MAVKNKIKFTPGETLESWAERVYCFELEYARHEISLGKSPDEVLEQMSKRITEKMMHPIREQIRNNPPAFDVEESRKRYTEIMSGHKKY